MTFTTGYHPYPQGMTWVAINLLPTLAVVVGVFVVSGIILWLRCKVMDYGETLKCPKCGRVKFKNLKCGKSKCYGRGCGYEK
jgi:hypothetical protein